MQLAKDDQGDVGATQPRPRARVWLSPLGLLVMGTLVWTLGTHRFHNSLDNYPEWSSTKRTLRLGVIGAEAFMRTPEALHGERLNLASFWGYNEVLFTPPGPLRELSWDAEVEDGSYVVVEYGRTEHGFSGVRLSRSSHEASVVFTASAEGEILEQRSLEAQIPARFHGALSFNAGRAELFIDGEVTSIWPVAAPLGQAGFRGGVRDALIDNVRAATASGEFLHTTFSNPRSVVHTFMLALASASIMAAMGGVGALLWSRVRRKARSPLRLRGVITRALGVWVIAGLFWLSVQGVSRLRPSGPGNEQVWHVVTHLPSILYFLGQVAVGDVPPSTIESWSDAVERLAGLTVAEGGVLYIGSSQTWGAGAGASPTWVERVQAQVEAAVGEPVSFVNAAISGATVTPLLEQYERDWLRFAPRLVVINLGNNDKFVGRFREGLEGFVRVNRARGIDTLFVLEANAPDTPNGLLPDTHAAMREVAAELQVPLVDLHGALLERNHRGFLWWDYVHLTDLGQRFAAEVVAPRVLAMLQASRALNQAP